MSLLKKIKLPLKALISAMILGILLLRVKPDEIMNMTLHFDVFYLTLALAFMLIQIVALAGRWHMLVNLNRPIIPFETSLRITVAGLLANFLLFTSISGVFVRIALIMQEGVKLSHALFSAITDRILTFAALAIMALLFLPQLAPYVEEKTFLTLSLAAGITVTTAFVFTPFFFHDSVRRIAYGNRKMAKAYKNIRTLLEQPALFMKIITISMGAQLCYFAAVYMISLSTEATFSFLQVLTVLPVIALVAALPISIGGWGVRESAFIMGLGLIGTPMETAFLISVQIGILSMVSTIVAGIPALLSGSAQSMIKSTSRFRSKNKNTQP